MPPPSFGTPTDLPELLNAVRKQISDVTGVPKHLVFPTLSDAATVEETPPGNAFVTVRPTRFTGIVGIVAGMGRAGRAYDGRLEVTAWFRLQTDAWLRDADWLTKDAGPLLLWFGVLDALEQFVPVRETDDTLALVIEPMRNDPGFDLPQKPRPQKPGWGRLDSTWECKFCYRNSDS